MYRHLISENHNNFVICSSPAIHCDGYRLLQCKAVNTCRHLPSLATKAPKAKVRIEECTL
jgi:hypothetical protein